MATDLTDRLGGAKSSLAFKAPCRVTTTANITLSGEQTIDGVAVLEVGANNAPDRVLVKDQTLTTENGIYLVSTGSWTRAKDFDGNDDIVHGTRIYVHSGSVGVGEYYITTSDPIIIDASSIAFSIINIGPTGPTGSAGSAAVTGTSTTSLAIGTGSKSFTIVETSRGWAVGARLRASSDATPTTAYMEGVVTSYSGVSLTISIDTTVGAGTHADWTINLAGEVGSTGPAGSGLGGSTGAVDNAVLRADGVGGNTVQSSAVTIDDTGNLSVGTTNSITTGTIEVGAASDTTISRSSAGNIAVEGNVIYRLGGTDVALADGGTGVSLADPNADRIMFWDDSAGNVDWLTAGTGLTITGTTIAASSTGGIATIASGSFPAANSLEITSIPATYAYLVLQVTGLSSNTTSRNPRFQLSTNNGSSYDTTVANYRTEFESASAILPDGVDASLTNYAPQIASVTFTATICIFGYQGGPNCYFIGYCTDSATTEKALLSGIYLGSTSAINALRMIWDSTGNSDAGTYALYGVS